MTCRCYEIYRTEDKIFFVQYKYVTALQDICRKNVGKIAKTKFKSLPDIMLITGKNVKATASFVENYFFAFSDKLWTYIWHMLLTVEKVCFSKSSPNRNNTYISFSIYVYCTYMYVSTTETERLENFNL